MPPSGPFRSSEPGGFTHQGLSPVLYGTSPAFGWR